MKHITRKINKYKHSSAYRERVHAFALGLGLLGLVLLDGYINTLILEG
jgi:hypothetical protein